MMTNTNTNDRFHVRTLWVLLVGAGWWLVFNRRQWCYAVLVVVLRHLPSTSASCSAQSFATWSHAPTHVACMYCISPPICPDAQRRRGY
jgi:hypothetical protein